MGTVRARIDKLEKQIGYQGAQSGCVVVARCGPNTEDLKAMLADRGIDGDDPMHAIIVFETVYEDKDGGIASEQVPAEILSITEKK